MPNINFSKLKSYLEVLEAEEVDEVVVEEQGPSLPGGLLQPQVVQQVQEDLVVLGEGLKNKMTCISWRQKLTNTITYP